jgi:hypothetical protein
MKYQLILVKLYLLLVYQIMDHIMDSVMDHITKIINQINNFLVNFRKSYLESRFANIITTFSILSVFKENLLIISIDKL